MLRYFELAHMHKGEEIGVEKVEKQQLDLGLGRVQTMPHGSRT
jgi:hypothetical protein